MVSYSTRELNVIYHIEEHYELLLNTFYKTIRTEDHHIVKQYIRFFIYLYFIDIDKDKYTSNDFYIQLCKLKKYIYFKFYYTFTPLKENLPQKYDHEKIMDSFMQRGEYPTLINSFAAATYSLTEQHKRNITPINLKWVNKYIVSNLIYDRIYHITTRDNFQRKQLQILKELNDKNTIKQCIRDNERLLKYIDNTNCFSYQPLHVQSTEKNNSRPNYIVTDISLTSYFALLKENTDKIYNIYNSIIESQQKENQIQLEKDYCRNTVLLDVDKLVKTLNTDVINIIRGFVGKDIIENVRVQSIQEKYFKRPKQTIEYMLSMWGNRRLKQFERNTPYLRYKIEMKNVYETPIYNYIHDDFLHYFYNEKIYKTFQKSKNEHVINRLLGTERVVDFYGFQRDVWILHHKVFNF